MASLEILLIKVRSDTPTSFFLVLSKTARLMPPLPPPPRPVSVGLALEASFLRPARFVTACMKAMLACISFKVSSRYGSPDHVRPTRPMCEISDLPGLRITRLGRI